jgi:hypothetical protein
MLSPFGQAADFFGRAYADQEEAAKFQDYVDGQYKSPSQYNLKLQSSTIGAVPPSAVAPSSDDETEGYVRGMKESLLERAREKRRPTNGDTAFRASGGVNTAVKR